VVSPDGPNSDFAGEAGVTLDKTLAAHDIEILHDFPIETVARNSVSTNSGAAINFDLLMLLPPFRGSSAGFYMNSIDHDDYINVDWTMRVIGHPGIYAVGDCVNFEGPKMGHMAVRQAEVAAVNLAAEIAGAEPEAHYSHELRLVIEDPGGDSIYLHKDIWKDEPETIRQGRFWSWAKRVQQKYWELSHS
jgi:sulfide:quinone oxidoreductase